MLLFSPQVGDGGGGEYIEEDGAKFVLGEMLFFSPQAGDGGGRNGVIGQKLFFEDCADGGN